MVKMSWKRDVLVMAKGQRQEGSETEEDDRKSFRE